MSTSNAAILPGTGPGESLEDLNVRFQEAERRLAEQEEYVRYSQAREGRSLVEDYGNGNLALVAYLDAGKEIGVDRPWFIPRGESMVRIPAMSIGRSDGMSITIPGDVDNALGAKRRR